MAYKVKTPVVLDVSSWQGNVNWPAVSPRPVLVMCKASEGTNFKDPNLGANWQALKSLNIRRGAYHYFHPEMDAAAQFANYQNAVKAAGGFISSDVAPALDVEGLDTVTPQLRKVAAGGIKTWLDAAQAFSGKTPILYTSQYQWSFVADDKGKTPAWSGNYPLWVAWFPKQPNKYDAPPANVIPTGWKQWAIWQYAKDGKLSGIQTAVDLDILSDWFAGQLDQPAPSPTPSPEPSPAPQPGRQVYRGTVVSPNGVNVRVKPKVSSKWIGSLVTGTNVIGKSIQVISPREAWLEIKDPVVGWCAIVYDGTTLISIKPD
jgi:lysozyme